ncbi:hypothetical protein GXW84_40015 [Rhodococcus sp. IEGM 248]|nr:hypothetical protein [Rhodococcus sp. IEGM 248]
MAENARLLALAPRSSECEQPLKKLAVPLECETKILRRALFAPSPLLLEPRTGLRESGGDPIDDVRHETIGLLDTLSGIIDEARLNLVPTQAEDRQLVLSEKSLSRR